MDRFAAAIQLPSAPARAPGEVDHTRPAAGAVLFEVAWEVCNQVGGIHQVLRSKAATIGDRWRDK
jgi:hypothetical protein